MPILNDFGFGIVGCKESEGYVALVHGTRYKLKLWNFNLKLQCDAAIKIDGKELGIWRVNPNQSIVLERPENDRGCFTFYKSGTAEAMHSGLEVGDELGLIAITFCPEKAFKPQPPITNYWDEGDDVLASFRRQIDLKSESASIASNAYSLSPGGTGLSGYSQDEYVNVEQIDRDHSKTTTIYLRLVAKVDEPRPLLGNPVFSTAIPKPID